MSSDQKNLYEHLIQKMILDGIPGMTSELRMLIEKAPIEKQRAMILNVMEVNNVEHRLLCNEIQKSMENPDTSEASHIKEVVQMLRKYVKVSKTEVKTMGEVMTPIELVEEMLDTLPHDIWSNPNLKWLDPCNGVGPFMAVVAQRLMNGLKTFEPDDNKRYKHIMENMIYVCELQAKNMFLFMYAFDPKDEYELNVYQGSFLDEGFDKHTKEVWGIEKFDVVVMNPPYQEQKPGFRKTQALWDKFVIKVIESNLNEGGYFCAVHPSSWRNFGGFENILSLLKSKEIITLNLNTEKDGLNTFGVETTYDFYCLKNFVNKGNIITRVKCVDGKIERVNISKMNFIPNGMFAEFQKLLAHDNEKRVEILMDSSYHTQRNHLSKEKINSFIHPIVYMTLNTGELNLWYSNTNQMGHFNIPKVIWSNGRSAKPYIDYDGSLGLSQFAYAIVDNKENLNFIFKAMNNPNFIKLMSFADGLSHRYKKKIIALFRKDFWVDFLDYDETAVTEQAKDKKSKPAKSGNSKPTKRSKKETIK